MKYLLVNRSDEIVFKVDLAGDVGINGAKTYFQGMKQMSDREQFDKLWKVITKKEYDLNKEAFERKPSSHPGVIEWWKEEPTNPDIEYD